MRIAIVGNGPSPVGQGLGKEIDKMDLVIRMHDCHLLLSNPDDYGSKYDYGVIPSPWFTKAADEVLAIPDKGWLVYVLRNQKRKKEHPEKLYGKKVRANVGKFSKLMHGLGEYPPTRGLSAVALALIYLKPTEIFLVGLDSVMSGVISQYHETFPAKVDNKYVGTHLNSRHNFLLESNKLKEFSELSKIPIQDILCLRS